MDSPPPSVSILEAPPVESQHQCPDGHTNESIYGSPPHSPHTRGRSPTVHGRGSSLESSPTPSSSSSMLDVPSRVHSRASSNSSRSRSRSRSSSGSPRTGTTIIFNSCQVTYGGSAGTKGPKIVTSGQPYYPAPGIPSPPLSGSDASLSHEDVLEGLHDLIDLSDVASDSLKSQPEPSPRAQPYHTPSPSSWNQYPYQQRQHPSPAYSHNYPVQASPASYLFPPYRFGTPSVGSPSSILKNSPHHRPRSQLYANPTMTPPKSPGHVHWKHQVGTELSHGSPASSLLFPEKYNSRLMHEEVMHRAQLDREYPPLRVNRPKDDPFLRLHDWRIQTWDEGRCQACGYEQSYMKCRGCDCYMCVMCYTERFPERRGFTSPPGQASLCTSLRGRQGGSAIEDVPL